MSALGRELEKGEGRRKNKTKNQSTNQTTTTTPEMEARGSQYPEEGIKTYDTNGTEIVRISNCVV